MAESTQKRTKPIKTPVLGVGDDIGSGDSYLVTDFFPASLADDVFEKLQKEVKWQTMHHRGGDVPRLVAVEGEIAADGSFPVYRHPADESPPLSPFSPAVSQIRAHAEKLLNHPLNHVLIQYYRTGSDYISEHSDKTVDIVRGSNIVNISFGAQRTMTLRAKKDKTAQEDTTPSDPSVPGTPRTAQRIPLPHNSMFVMGLETNAKWLHSINRDNRPFRTKSPEEQFKDGGRISLTFRQIGTFLTKDEARIWGQGAKNKKKEEAGLVIHDNDEVTRLGLAFGAENHQSDFDWESGYGSGFDILHFRPNSES
ncbi:hypothetical protein BDN70DRAFT_906563 [Pholiota conissans]|uniref:Fe2OG dioxygenase domain-containing protein n=1 Tax=Pholiota conissans TaxID=109636 RepID=A0A9P5Z1X4_9AGAR|nr:hypothetical protein BDN70DRAFT_906563 [Pholiota conissans]